MLRTTLDKAYIKRTIRPLYGWTQATPKSGFLDPDWDRSVAIYPGMAASRVEGDVYTLAGGANAGAGAPSGLFGQYIGGDGIDEVRDQGVNAIAVWVLAPDAEFEILAPAFDAEQTWTDTGEDDVLIHVQTTGATRGQLIPANGGGTPSTRPIARLVKVVSDSKIIIAGLRGTV